MKRLAAAVLLAAWAGAAMADPSPITLHGVDFAFHDVGRINNGWGAYYTPGRQEPEQSHDEIIVNYMDKADAQGNEINAKNLAERMLGSIKAGNGKVILPFAAPDKAYKDRLSYYVAFYYLYPQDGNGDIWITRIVQDDDRALGVLYKHRIDGSDAADIEARILDWLKQNMETTPVGTLVIPPEPPHG